MQEPTMQPVFTADTVVFNKAGEILLIKRKDNGLWALPGGKQKPCESLERAALRELKEETGLELAIKQLIPIDIYDDPDRDKRGLYISSAYYACLKNEQSVQAGSDASEVQWFLPDKLPRPLFADHEQIIMDAIVKMGG